MHLVRLLARLSIIGGLVIAWLIVQRRLSVLNSSLGRRPTALISSIHTLLAHGVVLLLLLLNRPIVHAEGFDVWALTSTRVDFGRRDVHLLRRRRRIADVSLISLAVRDGRRVNETYFGCLSRHAIEGATGTPLRWVVLVAANLVVQAILPRRWAELIFKLRLLLPSSAIDMMCWVIPRSMTSLEGTLALYVRQFIVGTVVRLQLPNTLCLSLLSMFNAARNGHDAFFIMYSTSSELIVRSVCAVSIW